ncbi:DUF58 domain-containing protein [Synoicihabitans lomoniglobus]|uniref:DUF58 domain-containing protein n=1 Tax=Synoicihabitans lomoniglobus TaxID=2909285 RepID=A0AAF0I7V5_9BACT|nr:DUF58 domain-containing protein [Opitutaceae bacterium LMO-M01]WED67051.1 DUF58 domain-containing protein [Opitutaceae bacterium LMO-M01]
MPAPAHLDPAALLAISDLELRARTVMEGLRSGLHRSPFSGFSAEFTEYRQYSPGDDLRYLDWKAYARTDRFYLKKFEEETNLRCLLLLDTSRSMDFGSRGYTKLTYARTLAATLASFLHGQRDLIGAALFDQTVHHAVAPRWRPGHLQHLYALLGRESPGRTTAMGVALQEALRLCRKRTLIVLLSDFLSPLDEWSESFAELAAAGHDVRVLQVLDPAERTLDFGQAAIWQDLENDTELYVDPAQARAAYLEKFSAHNTAVRQLLHEHGVPLHVIDTAQPLDEALRAFLQNQPRRASRVARRRASA